VRRRSSTRSNEAVERKHGFARLGARDVEDVSVARAPVRLPAGGAMNGQSRMGGHVLASSRVQFGSTVDARSIRFHSRQLTSFRCLSCCHAARRVVVDDSARLFCLRRFSDAELDAGGFLEAVYEAERDAVAVRV
jgi:hypothetical protein